MTLKTVSALSLVSILAVGCGGGGPGTNQSAPAVKNSQPTPTITLTATPQSVNQGLSATLAWSATNATSVSIDNGIGTVGLSDSRQITPTNNTTYTATATGAGGTASASVAVTVIPKPTVSVQITPSTVKAGNTATITWTSSNATSVTLDNGIGAVAASGSRTITPSNTATYTATAAGAAGMVTAAATITVVFPPTISFAASPSSITQGASTTLSWTSTNADSVSIDNNIGAEPPNGSVVVSPTSPTAYTATATGPGGTISSTFKVDVSNPPLPTVSLSVTPTTISAGQIATLSWTSTNGVSAAIDTGVGNVALNGNFQVSPGSTKTFTITVQGGGGSATASTTVTVGTPITTASPIKHVVVVLLQNNSFDHLFGTYPAANGNTVEGLSPTVPGYTQTDAAGTSVTPHLLADDAPPNLPEGDVAYRQVLTPGMDKFAFYNGDVAMGYYDSTTPGMATLWQFAQQFALADHYFGSVVGEAPTNQLYMVAAADLDRTFDVQPAYGPCQIAEPDAVPYTFPNVADQLSTAGFGWGVFEQSLGNCSLFMGIHDPFQFFTSTHDSPNVQDYSNFAAEVQNDILPAFSLIIPDSKHDMHPGSAPITNAITFVQTLVQQVQASPVWNSTAIIVTFDTGGGWYDHVYPPTVDAQGLAFRVPTLVISPYAKKDYVSHVVMDHVSILKLIQWNWTLPSLNTRNAQSGDMFDMFSFTAPTP
ncbi:MAG TPA: alkaline phosphatase family protein [Terriglobales bacterium]|nr:alkaline phosphatase family protein [Terriglobales bacterium]